MGDVTPLKEKPKKTMSEDEFFAIIKKTKGWECNEMGGRIRRHYKKPGLIYESSECPIVAAANYKIRKSSLVKRREEFGNGNPCGAAEYIGLDKALFKIIMDAADARVSWPREAEVRRIRKRLLTELKLEETNHAFV